MTTSGAPLRLMLFGATGRLGGHVLQAALEAGHSVTAFVRTPAALTLTHPRLRVIQGDVCDAPAVRAAMPGHDAVVSALGTAKGRAPRETLYVGMAAITEAMKDAGVRRIVAVASAGILQRDAETLRRDAPGYPPVFREASAAHLKAWEVLQASGLDWTLLCPPELEEGPPGAYQVLDDYLPEGRRAIRMASAAAFMLGELAAPAHLRRRVGLNDRA